MLNPQDQSPLVENSPILPILPDQQSVRWRKLADTAIAINTLLGIQPRLKIIVELARDIIGAHQALASLRINGQWSTTNSAVSFSDTYARWRSYTAAPTNEGIYAEVVRNNSPMRLTQEELVNHPHWRNFSGEADQHPPMRGWLVVPFVGRNGENLGLLQLSDKYEGDFTEDDELFLTQLAQIFSVALENAMLFEEAQNAQALAEITVERISRLQRVTAGLSGAVTPGQIARSILTNGLSTLGATACFIALLSSDRSQFDVIGYEGYDPSEDLTTLPVKRSWPPSEAIYMGQPVWIESRHEYAARYQHEAADYIHNSWAVVPLFRDKHVIGVLTVSFPLEHIFEDDDKEFILTVAQQTTQSLLRVQLYEAEQEARRQAEIAHRLTEQTVERLLRLQDITAALSTALVPQQVADVIIRAGIATLGASAGALALLNDDNTQFTLLADIGYTNYVQQDWKTFPVNDTTFMGRVAQTGQPLWIASRAQYREHFGNNIPQNLRYDAWATLPLLNDDGLLGTLTWSFHGERYFAPDDREFMLTLARQAAQAVGRAKLYQRAQDAIHQRDIFLSVAAHELKTPLTSLRGFAQMITRQMQQGRDFEPEKLQRWLSQIDIQSHKLGRLIGQLLDISRIDSGRLMLERKPVDLCTILNEIIPVIQMNAPRHTLILEMPSEVTLSLDPLRFEQVITNLIDNAIKYSPEGGPVTITLTTQDQKVIMSVTDHGLGIPPEHRHRIFDRFYQVHRSGHYGGMGLGLYISSEIIDLHDGELRAEFPPEGGTRFVITLPI